MLNKSGGGCRPGPGAGPGRAEARRVSRCGPRVRRRWSAASRAQHRDTWRPPWGRGCGSGVGASGVWGSAATARAAPRRTLGAGWRDRVGATSRFTSVVAPAARSRPSAVRPAGGRHRRRHAARRAHDAPSRASPGCPRSVEPPTPHRATHPGAGSPAFAPPAPRAGEGVSVASHPCATHRAFISQFPSRECFLDGASAAAACEEPWGELREPARGEGVFEGSLFGRSARAALTRAFSGP